MTLVGKVKELLDAIAEWQNVDCDVGDNGWTDENEGVWDDARGRMFRLKDEVRAELENGGDKVVVVTISEMLPMHGNEVDTVVCFDAPIACRGNVGMWEMPRELAARVTRADALALSVDERVASAEDAARLFRLAMPIAGGNEGFFVLPLDVERVAAQPTHYPITFPLAQGPCRVVECYQCYQIHQRAVCPESRKT